MEDEFDLEYADYDDTEEEYTTEQTDDDSFNSSDVMVIGGVVIAGLVIIAFVFKQIRKTFKKVHFKLGDKIGLEMETKEDKK